jgi:hypothetical protein
MGIGRYGSGFEQHRMSCLSLVLALGLIVGDAVVGYGQASATSDSLSVLPIIRPDSQRVVSPRSALLRAAVVPGWGQLYNLQYYKIPFIYGALGGLTGFVIYYHGQFMKADDAYQYAVRIGQDPNPFAEYEDEYLSFGGPSASTLRSFRNGQRRNRDLSVIGIIMVYGLSLLDAYVNAHLLNFDVGDDLSARLYSGPQRIGVTLRLYL